MVLAGLSGLLIFGLKRRFKLVVPLLFAASLLSVHAAGDSVVQATADAAGLAPATTLPRTGTFWIMTTSPSGQLTALPYPVLPSDLSALPAYSVAGNIYILDDTGGKIVSSSAKRMNNAQAAAIAQMQSEMMAALIGQILFPTNSGGGFQYNSYNFQIDTNGLYLERLNLNPTNLWLRLHNTVVGDNYQLLSTSNLLNTNWDLGQILFNANDGYTDFSPIPMTNAASFYRAHHAHPVMEIINAQDSEELNPTNTSDPGHAGIIYLQNEGWATNDVTVYYTIGGTAQNGVDYSNLTGVATVPVNQGYAEIDINPIADGLKPDQTIILTLLQNTNYLIDPLNYSATNTLYANPQVYPTAHGDIETPCPNTSWNIQLNANDPRGLPLTYTILTYPAHGGLTGTPPYMTYTPTNCYEGPDSFTFKVNDGQYDSAPATVTLIIANSLYANPVAAQICRGGSVQFTLAGGDNCETPGFQVATPLHGTVTNLSGQDYVYTPSSTNFTGTDTFNYTVYDSCGDTIASTVTITVGDASLQPNAQSVLTGTNRPVAVTLGAVDYDSCADDAGYYTYAITSSPTNGTLTGTPPNLTYRPNTNYEGADSFQFTVHDGALPAGVPATVSLYVVTGPLLAAGCNPFGPAVRLDWGLDDAVQQMVQQDGLNLSDFVVYRSAVAGGPYTAIYTNTDINQMSYEDTNAVIGQTNYYVVNFEFSDSGITYESPWSNEVKTSARNPNDLIAADAIWQVTDITDANNPINLGSLKAPFSEHYPYQYPNLYPLPNTNWPVGTTWTNHIALYIPTNTELTQVQYSITIDNTYWLYVNGSDAIDTGDNNNLAVWSSFKTFENVAPGLLHHGTNDLGVVIQDVGDINYFSMVVTTNACGP